jgi:hypothetical protein
VVLANYGLWRAARSNAGFNAYFHLDKTRSRELHSSDVLALRSRAQVRRRMSNARASYPNPKTTIAVTKAVEYLRAKQSYNGGFCFYKYAYLDQPNLRDTYHALQALVLAGAAILRRREVLEFLKRSEILDTGDLFHYVFSLNALGREQIAPVHVARAQALHVKRLDLAADSDPSRWLQSTHQIVQLQCRFAGPTDTPRILDAIADLEHGGGYGEKANLPDTALSLRILELLQETPSSLRESRVFVDGLQRPALGFTNTADSLSANLDVLTAGIECCALLRLPVRYQEDIFAFLFACQAADGSFSQVPLALPDIATTHQALKIIYALHFPKAVQPGVSAMNAVAELSTFGGAK